MIKVALVTTHAPERCGLATYAEALMQFTADSDIEYRVIGRPFDGDSILSRIGDADIVHILHVWSLFGGFTTRHLAELRRRGVKSVCTFNESTTENRSDFTVAFDRVVVHNASVDGFTHIPHGIWNIDLPEYKGENARFIGTAGFPIMFKNDYLVADIAQRFGLSVMAFLPESAHGDANAVKNNMLKFCGDAVIHTGFHSTEEIVRSLSTCLFTLFPHQHAGGGISGSVRFGLSARRPCIVTRTGRTSDLAANYSDEVYFIESGDPSANDILPVVRQVLDDIHLQQEKFPNRVVSDMSWEATAERYVQVYKGLMQ